MNGSNTADVPVSGNSKFKIPNPKQIQNLKFKTRNQITEVTPL